MSDLEPILVPFRNQKLEVGQNPELPQVPAYGALIARKKDGTLVPLQRANLSVGERLLGTYDDFAVVDKRILTSSLVMEIPSATQPFCFVAKIDLQIQVSDPILVLSQGLQDIRAFLLSKIQKRLLGIAAEFAIDFRRQAERECQNALDEKIALSDVGLKIIDTCIRVDMDPLVREQFTTEFVEGRRDKVLNTNQLLELIGTLKGQKLLEDWQAKEVINAWIERSSPQMLKQGMGQALPGPLSREVEPPAPALPSTTADDSEED
ncbi:hypothetical protein [Hyalangium versicolor]|uniref:hypothetical protein n=1 Tax=Hyalangium versicolor TaxID=2861190 RepID=UPI001CCA558E|nr:hypothetical protein [Hyalangium versicolor]